jgi:hypothetical protein
MPFATIAGVTYDVQTQGATEKMPSPIGMRRRTWNGGMRSGEQTDKRGWTLPLAPILESAFQTMRTNTKLAQRVTCVGDFTNGASLTCIVDITSATYYKPNAAGPLYRVCTLDIVEA